MKLRDRMRRGEKGFTLVELLIVVTILAILVAIVMANFSGLLSGSKTTANRAEFNIVQTAVDVKMAKLSWADWTPVITTPGTKDMTSTGFNLSPDYMRTTPSNCFYYVNAQGAVSQGACP